MYPFYSRTKEAAWSPLMADDSDDSIDISNDSFLISKHNKPTRTSSMNRLRHALPWALHGILICTYLALGTRLIKPIVPECFDGECRNHPRP